MGGTTRTDLVGGDRWWVMRGSGLHRLVAELCRRFDQVIGPVVDDGVIRLRPIASASELPVGVTDDQEAGSYRLVQTGTSRRFSYGVGPDSLKGIVHPARAPVWTMRRRDGTLAMDGATPPSTSHAVVGVRACDLRALTVLERTQTGGPHADPNFVARRAALFLVAVDCTSISPTCFCDTTGAGRAAADRFDLALTEFDDEPHGAGYLVRCGSDQGRALVEELGLGAAPEPLGRRVTRAFDAAADRQLRELPPDAAAVVHTHSPRATALACAGRGIPPFHYMIAIAGGPERVTVGMQVGLPESGGRNEFLDRVNELGGRISRDFLVPATL